MDLAKIVRDVFTRRAARTPAGEGPPHLGTGPVVFGDNARVRRDPCTEAAGIADKTGQIFGETTPSVTGVEVVGEPHRDYAINVYFAELKRSVWLAEELVEFLDHAPGSTMTIGGKTLVRRADGEWEPEEPG